MSKSYKPAEYAAVSPYIIVDDPEMLMRFLVAVFDGVVIEKLFDDSHRMIHGEVRIENAVIMLGQAREGSLPSRSSTYIYVNDVDCAYKKALAENAISIQQPEDQFYGDRSAGVKGPFGNDWWMATRQEDIRSEEIQKRWKMEGDFDEMVGE